MYNVGSNNKNASGRFTMLQNLHTHSTFCDGKNPPEDMVKKAIELKFSSIGFSSHAPTCFHDYYEMKDVDGYISCIRALREKYSEKTEILLGVEMDYYSIGELDTLPFDYKIGSVHTSKYGDELLFYDLSAEKTKNQIENFFAGDGVAFAKTYYEKVAELPYLIDVDFIGHFDIVTKFSERDPSLIDTESKKYRSAALDALHTVFKKCEFFEVNTGAIGRGYRTTPYPEPFILDEMKLLGAKLLITSDCHNMNYLNVGFDDALALIRSRGFDTVYYLTSSGFVGEKI